eukprot:352987-Chlamydomonas_euryale.AAC.11
MRYQGFEGGVRARDVWMYACFGGEIDERKAGWDGQRASMPTAFMRAAVAGMEEGGRAGDRDASSGRCIKWGMVHGACIHAWR